MTSVSVNSLFGIYFFSNVSMFLFPSQGFTVWTPPLDLFFWSPFFWTRGTWTEKGTDMGDLFGFGPSRDLRRAYNRRARPTTGRPVEM